MVNILYDITLELAVCLRYILYTGSFKSEIQFRYHLKIFLLNEEFWKDTHANYTSDKGQLPTECFYV